MNDTYAPCTVAVRKQRRRRNGNKSGAVYGRCAHCYVTCLLLLLLLLLVMVALVSVSCN